MTGTSGLDDPRHAQFAWARFRRILSVMSALSLIIGLGVAGLLWWLHGALPWGFTALVVGGIWATIMTAAVLMGLIFLSSGTGHDESVHDPLSEDVLAEYEQ